MSNKKLIWLDCDPGHDDSLAIILAAYTENIRLIGISTSNGNQIIQKTTENALNVMNFSGLITAPTVNIDQIDYELPLTLQESLSHGGMKFPLLQGSSKPLLRPGKICDEIHGDSGLDTHVTIEFPKIPNHARKYFENVNFLNSTHFTNKIYDYFKSFYPQKITIVTTGPLTNVALLLINYPDVTKYIDKLILMGGALGIGNTGAVAEFNIEVDPEAASLVFDSDMNIFMVPLEVTHTILATKDILERIGTFSSNFSRIIIELLLFFKSNYKNVFFMDDPPLHDPCAIAFAIDQSMFQFKLLRVDIETHSQLSYGQTVCDFYDLSKKKKNVHVCLKIDSDKFWTLLIESIEKANKNSPANFKKEN